MIKFTFHFSRKLEVYGAHSVQAKYLIPRPLRDGFNFELGGFVKASIRAAILAVAFFTAHKTSHPGLTALE